MKKSNSYLSVTIGILMIGGIAGYGGYRFNRKLNHLNQQLITNQASFESFQKSLDTFNKQTETQGNAQRDFALTTRSDFIKRANQAQHILEIGPFFAPAMMGENVKYFDVYDKATLQKKATEQNYDASKVPFVHFVHPNGDLTIIHEKFDAVFSSHNIEHQVDLIQHLNRVSDLLQEGGTYYLIIPDKRYCFDHFIPTTALSEVIATYYEKRQAHDLRTILAMFCETGHNDPARHWANDRGKMSGEANAQCYQQVLKTYEDAKGAYIDSHKWRFTPDSFQNIMTRLNDMGLSPLKVKEIYDTNENTFEFMAVLSK